MTASSPPIILDSLQSSVNSRRVMHFSVVPRAEPIYFCPACSSIFSITSAVEPPR